MSSMPTGQEVYNADAAPVVARGLAYTDQQLDEILQGPVKVILQDTTGADELRELLSSVVSTDFEQEGLEELLADNTAPDNWRVGEAIAESFVTDHGDCVFPWPTGRDLKNPNASPAGCDLTGFRPTSDDSLPYRFAFGEVKTSEQEKSPPDVMNSLGGQLKDLRDKRKVKDSLCRYLGHHAPRADWEPMYKSAAKRYLQSNAEDISIYGVLVRDVEDESDDLAGRATALARSCPAQTAIELYALYLPKQAISSLSDSTVAAANDGGEQ